MKISLLLLAGMMLSSETQTFAEQCSFGSQPTIIEKIDAGPNPILLQFWDLSSDRILSLKSLPDSRKLAEYRETVGKRITTEPLGLLRRYRSLKPASADLHNIAATESRPGNIKKMGCLAGLLLDIQINRN